MMNTMKVLIPYQPIRRVLEEAKIMKTEYVVIPRILFQNSPMSSIIGSMWNASYSIGKFDKLNDIIELWPREYNLEYICLMPKDISPFKKVFTDTYGGDKYIDKIWLVFTEYEVNGNKISIAHMLYYLDSDMDINNSITLYPYQDILTKTNTLINWYNSSKEVYRGIVTENEQFLTVMQSKASDGATEFIPSSEKYRQYITYISKSLLNVAKNDIVEVGIADKIIMNPANRFMINYTVTKKSKKAVLNYYTINLKLL